VSGVEECETVGEREVVSGGGIVRGVASLLVETDGPAEECGLRVGRAAERCQEASAGQVPESCGVRLRAGHRLHHQQVGLRLVDQIHVFHSRHQCQIRSTQDHRGGAGRGSRRITRDRLRRSTALDTLCVLLLRVQTCRRTRRRRRRRLSFAFEKQLELALGQRRESDTGQFVEALEDVEEVDSGAKSAQLTHLIGQEDGRMLLLGEAWHTGELARQNGGHTFSPQFGGGRRRWGLRRRRSET